MFGLRFENDDVANGIKRLVLNGGQPAAVSVPPFELGNFIHDVLPGAGRANRITRLPVNPRQMQTEPRSFVGLILGGDQTEGFVFVAGVKGFLFLGYQVFVVISAPPSAEHAVSLFHLMFHGYEHEPSKENPVSEQWPRLPRIVAEFFGH